MNKTLIRYIKSYAQIKEQEIFWLLEQITELTQAEIIIQPELFSLNSNQNKALAQALVEYKILHKPLQYILKKTSFLDLSIIIKPPILIPRPETEEWTYNLIQKLSKNKKEKLTVLDMCTGSGVIGLSIAKAFPYLEIIAADINPAACELANINSVNNNINNISIINSDLFDKLDKETTFDLITMNPPYINLEEYNKLDLNVKNWEDKSALFSEDNGLYLIKKFAEEAKNWLNSSGQIYIEIGYNQGIAVKEILEKNGYKNIYLEKDFAQKDRLVQAIVK